MKDDMDWVGQEEERRQEEVKKGYFTLVEGDNKIQLLTHCAKLVQVYMASEGKYRIAKEGDKNPSIKGLCYVYQDGLIKEAKLPYTVVKQIQALRSDPDWAFEKFPMPRFINIKTKNAGTKQAEYTVMPSPKITAVPAEIVSELSKKPTPEQVIERMKERSEKGGQVEYPSHEEAGMDGEPNF